ncbi:hypothetical protein, partial [Vibrio vulnificus]|uniref:hypothetical protein n=1 Tax=Vibrio vulnificus TaxID=672 RepID=UPI0019D4A252
VKESYIATWSDEEEEEREERTNLALMAIDSYSSDEESEVNHSTIDNELLDAFESLHVDYSNAIKDNKLLKKKNKLLESENDELLVKLNKS